MNSNKNKLTKIIKGKKVQEFDLKNLEQCSYSLGLLKKAGIKIFFFHFKTLTMEKFSIT